MSDVFQLVRPLYNRLVRPYLPSKWAVYADVPARDLPLLDMTDDFPDYKRGLIDAIHETVAGQTVDVVALGRGISTVHCLRAGANQVNAFEASSEMIRIADRTLDVGAPERRERVEIEHALVGEGIHVYGDEGAAGAGIVSPAELTGDVLILDCEGAERSIIDGLDSAPTIVVETHPEQGYPTEETVRQLEECGYSVSVREYEPLSKDRPNPHPDKRVLVGTLPR